MNMIDPNPESPTTFRIEGRTNDSHLKGTLHPLLSGDCGGLTGDVTGIYGIATNIIANFNECPISLEYRVKGISIQRLLSATPWIRKN